MIKRTIPETTDSHSLTYRAMKSYLAPPSGCPLPPAQAERLWRIDEKNRIPVPERLAFLLSSFDLATAVESPDVSLIRPRLTAILLIALARAKEKAEQLITEMNLGPEGEEIIKRLSDIHWDCEEKISVKHNFEGQDVLLENEVETLLSSGGGMKGLETHFPVCRKKTLGVDESAGVLSALCLIHQARKKAGRNALIYGVTTDSYEWTFYHISNGSYYSELVLRWKDGEQDKVFGLLCHILINAVISTLMGSFACQQ
ncbi:hypothetical protein BJX61DRAFT_541038 [Aspergillus egyptiacus]|nr:hypothetical protein BJX61DRAFT_541038 [Aspergillus egyptiacus]